MLAPLPLTRELALIGGGHTHALVLRRWGMAPLPGARLTLINPGPTAPYTGMLPGYIAGHYGRDALEIDLVRLARFAGARLVMGSVEGIDRGASRIHVPGRPPIAYDLASINIGITTDLPDLPGFADHAVPAKPLGAFAAAWTEFRAAAAEARASPSIAVIGGGIGGVELAMAMAHALRQDGHNPKINVIEKDRALPGISARAREILLREARALGVSVREKARPAEVSPSEVALADGTRIASGFTVGAAGARPFDWLEAAGLDLENGFVAVDGMLRSSDPAIYAAGDCASLADARPKAGVFAVRAAPVLFHNLRAGLSGRALRHFQPQRDYLKLVSLGGKSALAEKWGLAVKSPFIWDIKDRIDGRFMEKFRHLPPMQPPALPRIRAQGVAEELGRRPLCGGCGSKVGYGTLKEALRRLPAPARTGMLARPGDDAAVIAVGDSKQALSTDHLRAFTEDPWTMARVAAVHAMGDIWAMGGMPQAALATIILPRMAGKLQGAWLEEIMDGANSAFAAEGAAIVGGHTTLGSELAIGFTVTGAIQGSPIQTKGAKAGDALILTKPIGTGTILAAEMECRARGAWVASAIAAMAEPQGAAANCLSHAHAMTDVTGFGLAGHLMAICSASGLAAEIQLDAVPFLEGAEEMAKRGIRSTLYPENLKVAEKMNLPAEAKSCLLFDPQTSGGLLAAIDPATVPDTLEKLENSGCRASKIGAIVKGAPFISVV